MSDWLTVLEGDCRETLKTLPNESVQCCVTSPPYWGLRDYGHKEQLGAEATYQEYVANMGEVFREVHRVLKPDGTLWLNLGDCYATGAGKVGDCPGGGEQGERWKGYKGARGGHEGKHTYLGGANGVGPMTQPNRLPQAGLKPKDLVGIPWRVAFALQAEGWWLRSDIIWAKPNPMPESVTDRPTKAHEYIFLLTKSESYFYDHEAIKEPAGDWHSSVPGRDDGPGQDRRSEKVRESVARGGFDGKTNALPGREAFRAVTETRNKRSVWTVASRPYRDAHFATYPPALITPCILAGTKPGDVVLDPFAGSGTTGEVALQLGRRAILCELNPEYLKLVEQRTTQTIGLAL